MYRVAHKLVDKYALNEMHTCTHEGGININNVLIQKS